jgi:catecholate siderophore receptor
MSAWRRPTSSASARRRRSRSIRCSSTTATWRDYGLPPVRGFPADVNRNNAYGFSDDRTNQAIIMLGATVEHKFNKDLVLRNQTQFNYVNTNAHETAPQSVGTVTGGVFTAAPAGGFTGQPLSNLFVRQQTHDRNIYDITVYNQTELTSKFDTGPFKHNLLTGIELGYESYYNQNYYRFGSCNGVPMQAASSTNGYIGCTSLLYPRVAMRPVRQKSPATWLRRRPSRLAPTSTTRSL